MDLKTFVSESLLQIVAGVYEAQQEIAKLGTNASVNPAHVPETTREKRGAPSAVEFDVAITVASEATDTSASKIDGRAKGGILQVFSAEIGSEIGDTKHGASKNETVSRLKFSVQLAQPAQVTTYSTAIRSPRAVY